MDPEHDSTNSALGAEQAAEKKVIWLWQQMDQMYGVRWSQSFGNDPLGKYKNAQGQQNPRMEQWIDALRTAQWPAIKQAVYRIRMFPKPYEGWLPDLQSFTGFLGSAPRPRPPEEPKSTWVDSVCGAYLFRLQMDHGPFSLESVAKLEAVNREAREKFNVMLVKGELSKEALPEEKEVILNWIKIEHRKLTIEQRSPEETQEEIERWRRKRGLT